MSNENNSYADFMSDSEADENAFFENDINNLLKKAYCSLPYRPYENYKLDTDKMRDFCRHLMVFADYLSETKAQKKPEWRREAKLPATTPAMAQCLRELQLNTKERYASLRSPYEGRDRSYYEKLDLLGAANNLLRAQGAALLDEKKWM